MSLFLWPIHILLSQFIGVKPHWRKSGLHHEPWLRPQCTLRAERGFSCTEPHRAESVFSPELSAP